MPLQSHLSSLTLVRLLQEWAPVSAEPPRQDVAERLGEWLSPMDSVKLDGALQAIAAYGASPQAASRAGAPAPVDAGALAAMCQRAQSEWMALVAGGLTGDAAAADAGYGPHHQRYLALQKQMEAKARACRAQVRQALSRGSPRLRQLGALDGVMAEMLAEREQRLLGAVPVYLERRFTHWRQWQAQRLAMAGQAGDEDDGQGARQAGGWLHGFEQDMRRALLAEWQARLQPVLGLIDAVREDENR